MKNWSDGFNKPEWKSLGYYPNVTELENAGEIPPCLQRKTTEKNLEIPDKNLEGKNRPI